MTGLRHSLMLAFFSLLLVSIAGPAQAQTLRVLYSFSLVEAGNPLASLILDTQGNLYGTTQQGGAYRKGTVFEVRPNGAEKVLYTFTGGKDGDRPIGGLIQDAQGNLYGTTQRGGASGHGTAFVISPSGAETVLYSFTGGADASDPWASLIQDAQGNLYGTTTLGGAYGSGTVFVVEPGGVEKVLYSFTGGKDGDYPVGGLIRDSKGNLYGTTISGGAYGYGTVFRVSPSRAERLLYSFTGGADGASPFAGLVQDAQGNLFGTTQLGGAYGQGTVFVVEPNGVEKVLHSFTGGADGCNPVDTLVHHAGNLYGTAWGCGTYGWGTAFVVEPGGVEKVLYSFNYTLSSPAGANPGAGFVQDAQGNLYGTTTIGGAYNSGSVFMLLP